MCLGETSEAAKQSGGKRSWSVWKKDNDGGAGAGGDSDDDDEEVMMKMKTTASVTVNSRASGKPSLVCLNTQ